MGAKNPFLRRRGCHGTKAEQRAAKRLGATLTPASGALEGCKGDMVKKDFRIESKSTTHDSMTIQADWLRKIAQEAIEHNQYPALTTQFVTRDGKPIKDGSWVMVPEYLFLQLIAQEED